VQRSLIVPSPLSIRHGVALGDGVGVGVGVCSTQNS
jgi:hypothetical protein